MAEDEISRHLEEGFQLEETSITTTYDFRDRDDNRIKVSRIDTSEITPIGLDATYIIWELNTPIPGYSSKCAQLPSRKIQVRFAPNILSFIFSTGEKSSVKIITSQLGDGSVDSITITDSDGKKTDYMREIEGNFSVYSKDRATARRIGENTRLDPSQIPYLEILGIDTEQQRLLVTHGIDILATRASVEGLFASKSPRPPTSAFVYKDH